MDKMVYGQNGMGQDGTDKIVRIKLYVKMVYDENGIGQMAFDKMVRTKWYGQNGTDKIISQSIDPALTNNLIFSSITLTL